MQPLAVATHRDRPAPAGIPGLEDVQSRAAAENFPVALRVVPRRLRADLLAVYGFARLADELGDRYGGDRFAALDWLESDLGAAVTGHASHPAVAILTPTIDRHQLDLQPFRDLIAANRRDQHQHRYATFAELLLDYCRLSANPVGRIVLAIFGVTDPDAQRWSDDVCSGLQVVEHLQDVGEDAAAGRIYLPQDDLAACGCTDADLRQPTASTAVRTVVARQAERAAALLASGTPLVKAMRAPVARLAVAGFVAGGLAALDDIAAAGHDVLAHRCRPARHRTVRHAATLLARSVWR